MTDMWRSRATQVTPAGVHSNARIAVADLVFTHGDGPWLFDTNGTRYVDYMLGRGPALLGHTPTAVNDAVYAAVQRGITLGSATPGEIEASEAVLSVIPWADQIRFTSSGTEAVQAAFRLARAATKRQLVMQFDGLYHGWVDTVSLVAGPDARSAAPGTQGQIANSAANTILLPWNDVDAVSSAFEQWGDQIAAVITEPVNIFGGTLAAPGYLQHLRDITHKYGTVLIFDEVVSGFRLQPGSAASLVGVTPDLGTFAKAMGAGWPVSAVAGKSELFEGVAENRVTLSGTYNGNAAAMAAVTAAIAQMADGTLHAAMNRWGSTLMSELERIAAAAGSPLKCEGFPTAFWMVFEGMARNASDERAEAFNGALKQQQVIQYHHTWLTSAAHDDEALAFTVAAVKRAFAGTGFGGTPDLGSSL